MFIGHLAPALIAAALPRRPLRLGPAVLAALLVDIVFFVLVLLGVEHFSIRPGATVMMPFDLWDMFWSHSLLGTLGWAAGFAAVVKLVTRDPRLAWIGAGVVASHWPLDLIVHAPDLTVLGVGRRYGWGLWDHPYVAMPLELLIAFVAFAFYLNRTRAIDWRGRAAAAALAIVAVAMQLWQWLGPQPAADLFRPPAAASISALAAFTILIVLAWWTGDYRQRR